MSDYIKQDEKMKRGIEIAAKIFGVKPEDIKEMEFTPEEWNDELEKLTKYLQDKIIERIIKNDLY